MKAIFEGKVPPPPIMATIASLEASWGSKAVFLGDAGANLYNPIGRGHRRLRHDHFSIPRWLRWCTPTLAVGEHTQR